MHEFFEDVPDETPPCAPQVIFVPPSGEDVQHIELDPPLAGEGVTYTDAWVYRA